ncbi:MAG: hypothetical protein RLZZ385_1487 [Pseudomonadota bacterium]|jgi:NADH dehydrogenase
MKIAITGANSRVGQTLVEHTLRHSDHTVLAGARSRKALGNLPTNPRVELATIDYADVKGLTAALSGASCVVHLAGILMEGKGSTYQSANVDATAAVMEAARQAGVEHVVFISVVGADANSANAYFKSKADAEAIVADAGLSATIIRTPILLGPGAAGAAAIQWAASSAKPRLLGGGRYTMHPLDIDDLCVAILNSCNARSAGIHTHELVGPQAVQYGDLIRLAAGLQGRQVEIVAVPIWMARLGARLRGLVRPGGMTPTVIDVITKDEVVAHNADQVLGVTLTPLSQTLEKFIKPV